METVAQQQPTASPKINLTLEQRYIIKDCQGYED
jgi:hypothetical protein